MTSLISPDRCLAVVPLLVVKCQDVLATNDIKRNLHSLGMTFSVVVEFPSPNVGILRVMFGGMDQLVQGELLCSRVEIGLTAPYRSITSC